MSVFHLKYRPGNLDDLDSLEVSRLLRNVFKNQEVPQSWLFSGPKGAGKTSAARIVAKIVNCNFAKDGDACDKCENCREIKRGGSIDVIEMDGASNRGIEDIRSLKDKAYLLPTKLKRKVFIIDEVHMLTKEAFNALLKLIEEPPKHTMFILCTTDESKIPETVVSRLFRVGFTKGKQAELKKSLMRVIKGEGMEVEEKAVDLLVSRSDGSFRNLQKTFNELAMEYPKKITYLEAEAFLVKQRGEYQPEEMETDLIKGEPKVILIKLEKLAEKGIDFKNYREDLLRFFQEKLLEAYGAGKNGEMKNLAYDLERWLGLLITAGKIEKEVSIDQLPLELAVVQFLNNGENDQGLKEITLVDKPVDDDKNNKLNEEVDQAKVDISLEKIDQEWQRVLREVKPFNHSVEAFLRATKPKSVSGQTVVLEVYYPFHKDKLEEEKNRTVVEESMRKVFGAKMKIKCVLGKSNRETLVIKNDTPLPEINKILAEDNKQQEDGDMYNLAKEIFS